MTYVATPRYVRPASPAAGAVPPPGPARTAGPHAPRMAWLDALRGFAALVVAYFHLQTYVLDRPADVFDGWLDLGRYGVLLFFLVSGYVIMMSLERYGSLRRFWVGRIFRIYPAWLLTALLMAVVVAAGVRPLGGILRENPEAAVLGHATMLQELLGLPSFVNVFWTLSYEMVFYLLISGLFVLGLHRRCAWWAVGLAVTALVTGRLLPNDLFTGGAENLAVLSAAVTLVLAGTVAAYISGRRTAAVVAAVAGIGMVLLPALNGGAHPDSHAPGGSWRALSFLTVMLAGTVVYAAQQGRLSRRATVLTLGAVLVCQLVTDWVMIPQPWQSVEQYTRGRHISLGTLLAVVATFAIGFALRHRRVPGWMAWLGRVSYSIYLLHPLVRVLLPELWPGAKQLPFAAQLGIGAVYLAATLLLAWAAYRWVERPGQRLGKHVAGWLDRRLRADRCVRTPDAPAAPDVPAARSAAAAGGARSRR
jgi:peptidoglycan/LPS O-acetylase OafA/YrhL